MSLIVSRSRPLFGFGQRLERAALDIDQMWDFKGLW